MIECLSSFPISSQHVVRDSADPVAQQNIGWVDASIELKLENNFCLFLVLPPGIANLINLEILNLSNNHLDDLPLSLSSMPKLRILNCSINRLNSLPRWVTRLFFATVYDANICTTFSGFGAFPMLEVLDLSYNNLNENVLPGNFFKLGKNGRSSLTLSC